MSDRLSEDEAQRILKVYRRSVEGGEADLLKGLVLRSRGFLPDTAEEASEMLRSIVGGYGVDCRFGEWGSVRYALSSLEESCPGLTVDDLVVMLCGGRSDERRWLDPTPRGASPISGFVESDAYLAVPSVTMMAAIPREFRCAVNAADERDVLAALALGFRRIEDAGKGWFIEGTFGTVVLPDEGRQRRSRYAEMLREAEAHLDEGGRAIMLLTSGVLFIGSRNAVEFRRELLEDTDPVALVRIVTPFRCASVHGVMIVADIGEYEGETSLYDMPEGTSWDAEELHTGFVDLNRPDELYGDGTPRAYMYTKPNGTVVKTVRGPDCCCEMSTMRGDAAEPQEGPEGGPWTVFDPRTSSPDQPGVPLSGIADVRSGTDVPPGKLGRSGYVYVTPSMVRDGPIEVQDDRRVERDDRRILMPKTGDILVSCYSNIGDIHIVTDDDPPMAVSGRIAVISLEDGRFLPRFVAECLGGPRIRRDIERCTTGRMMRVLPVRTVAGLVIPDLDKDVQREVLRELDEGRGDIDSVCMFHAPAEPEERG